MTFVTLVFNMAVIINSFYIRLQLIDNYPILYKKVAVLECNLSNKNEFPINLKVISNIRGCVTLMFITST
jgi:hypothetical protein